MKRRSISRFSIMIVLLLSIGLLTIITTNAQSSATIQVEQEISPPPSNSENWKAAELVLRNLNNRSSVNIPLPPNKDPCLHCHITGENKGLWTPLARWILVGSMGMFLTFGIYRSASVWVTKTPWKPIRARTVDWVDERYNISKPLQKVLSKPVPKFALRWWYCLGQ